MGIYLGRSPSYSRNVALILNRDAGHVSPQFHIRLDPTYKSIHKSLAHNWVKLAGLGAKADQVGNMEPNIPVLSKRAANKPCRERTSNKRRRLSAPKMPDDYVDVAPATDEIGEYTPTLNQDMIQPPSDDGVAASPPSEGEAKVDGIEPGPAQATADEQPIKGSEEAVGSPSYSDRQDRGEDEVYAFSALFGNDTVREEDDYIKAFKATSDPDTMYHHQAMQEPDRDKFREAMIKEWKGQANNKNFTLMRRSDVPEGATILPAVWQMRRKRDVRNKEIQSTPQPGWVEDG